MDNRLNDKMTNPIVRQVSNVNGQYYDETVDRATYNGIYAKVGFFIGMVILGVVAAFVLHAMYAVKIPTGIRNEFIEVSMVELIVLALATITYVICSLIAAFVPASCKIAGTIACGSIGLTLGISINMLKEYREPAFLALIITVLLVVAMWLVYANGYIRVDGKFKTLMMTVLFTWVLSGLALFICSFIPGLNTIVSGIFNNPAVAIGIALIGVVIAAFFLLMDFDSIVMTVEEGLPKNFEWMAAYSLAFGMIWVYFKVLDLLLTIKNSNR